MRSCDDSCDRRRRAAVVVTRHKAAPHPERRTMASTSSAVALPGVEDKLLALLRAELTGEEQRMFVEGFAAYLTHDARRDFVVDLDGSREWLGFSTKANAKKAVVKHLKEGTHFKVLLIQVDEQNGRGGHNKEQVLLTVHGFKQLCMAANTDKARKVRDYYIAMEEVMFEYTKRKMELQAAALAIHAAEASEAKQHAEDAKQQAEDAKQIAASQAVELERYRSKTYEEVPKLEEAYVFKDFAHLHVDIFKTGIAGTATSDSKKREQNLNTALAAGGKMINVIKAHSAAVAEKVWQVTLKRYHYHGEHYQCRLEHLVNTMDAVCTMVDTLSSTYEHITRGEMLAHLVAKLTAVMGASDQGAPPTDGASVVDDEVVKTVPYEHQFMKHLVLTTRMQVGDAVVKLKLDDMFQSFQTWMKDAHKAVSYETTTIKFGHKLTQLVRNEDKSTGFVGLTKKREGKGVFYKLDIAALANELAEEMRG